MASSYSCMEAAGSCANQRSHQRLQAGEHLLWCRPHLAAAQERALADQADSQDRFRSWAAARVPGARHMNVGSGPQARQLCGYIS
jgi:hypothetical protein